MIGAFIVGLCLALYVSLMLHKHGMGQLLRMIGASIYASGYAYEYAADSMRHVAQNTRAAWRHWYERKMQEQQA